MAGFGGSIDGWVRPLGRRAALRGALIAGGGIAAAALVGCGDDDEDDQPAAPAATAAGAASGTGDPKLDVWSTAKLAPAPAAKRGGTLRNAGAEILSNMDSMKTQGATDRSVGSGIYSQMVHKKGEPDANKYPSFDVVPDIAKSWEVTPDGLTYTFKLVTNAYFHPPVDRLLTAQDVKYSMTRWQSVAVNKDQLDMVSAVDTPNAETAIFRLSRPLPIFLNRLSDNYTLVIYPTETESRIDPTKQMVGSGPWILEENVPSVVVRLKKHPKWHYGPDLPYLERVDVNNVPQYETRTTQFFAGNVDIAGTLTGDDLIRARDRGFQIVGFSGTPGMGHIAFGDPRDTGPWKDDRVRKAVSMGIDRVKLFSAVFEIDTLKAAKIDVPITINGMIPASIPSFWVDPTKDTGSVGKWLKYDVAEAKKLLDAAGFKDGFEAKFHYTTVYGAAWKLEAEILPQMLQGIGLKLTSALDDFASVYSPRTFAGNFDGLAYILNAWPEPDNYLTAFYTPGAGRNQSKVNDPTLLAEITRVTQISEPAARTKAIKDIQQTLAEKMYYVPGIGWSGPRWTAAGKYLRNWSEVQIARGGSYTAGYAQYWLDK